jgi:hypothetical protein
MEESDFIFYVKAKIIFLTQAGLAPYNITISPNLEREAYQWTLFMHGLPTPQIDTRIAPRLCRGLNVPRGKEAQKDGRFWPLVHTLIEHLVHAIIRVAREDTAAYRSRQIHAFAIVSRTHNPSALYFDVAFCV